jgi:Mg-chelatase subunit ChlI
MHHKFVIFPLSAIVGQDLLKKALLINAIDPTVGGVIITGDKGTGKSTAVRALAHSLPRLRTVEGCPFNCDPENMRLMCKACQQRFEREGGLPWIEKAMEVVDMPLSSTEDMVIGSIDIKRALAEGVKALEPGIMARANRNILYIDEINLLDDHLINILLDAAAMGVNLVEREGISLYHPARFILIGTMNPEEGRLRPQILDRFGLCVDVGALTEPHDRLEIVKRRKAFDRDCWAFEEQFAAAQQTLKTDIAAAQQLLPRVAESPQVLEQIVSITSSLGIRTHRADIVMEKTAAAIAALAGRTELCREDVVDAALLALPHRMRQKPFEKERPLDRQQIESALDQQTGREQPEAFERSGEVKKKS